MGDFIGISGSHSGIHSSDDDHKTKAKSKAVEHEETTTVSRPSRTSFEGGKRSSRQTIDDSGKEWGLFSGIVSSGTSKLFPRENPTPNMERRQLRLGAEQPAVEMYDGFMQALRSMDG